MNRPRFVTPCVDVLLLLFVLYFVTSAARRQALEPLQLPRAGGAAPIEPDERALELSIDRDGRITVQGKVLTPVKLEDLFEARRQRGGAAEPRTHRLRLRADRRAPFTAVRAVLDAARRYGAIDRVELIVNR